jgi:hypothetical protein
MPIASNPSSLIPARAEIACVLDCPCGTQWGGCACVAVLGISSQINLRCPRLCLYVYSVYPRGGGGGIFEGMAAGAAGPSHVGISKQGMEIQLA